MIALHRRRGRRAIRIRCRRTLNEVVRIGETTITGQDTGATISAGGTIASYGDNHFVDGVDGVPVSTAIPLK